MKIYLIRHGETTGDIEDRYGGDYDDHLTDRGKEQAKELVKKLENKGVEIIYHSPRIRAVETAQIVGKKLGVKVEAVDDLRERNNYGILTGMVKSETKQKYPKEVEKLKKSKLHHKVKGSEDYEHFKKRVVSAFNEIIENDEYDTVAIISHGGPISCVVRKVLKLGEIDHLGDCAILEIEKKNGKLKLVKIEV